MERYKMKNILYIFLFATQALFAQDAFDKGNTQFKQGRYEEAAASYESILKGNEESAEVYFNLGNTYYKLGKTAPAIYNYEKSLLLDPGNRDIEVNLGYANDLVTDNIEPVAKVGFAGMMDSIAGNYHYDTWAWTAVLAAFITVGFFAGYYFSGSAKVKRLLFVGMSISVIVLITGLVSAFFVKSVVESEHPAIVFSTMAQVKAEPTAASPETFLLHEGVKVYVTGTKGTWKQVRLPDESVGWVDASAIKEL